MAQVRDGDRAAADKLMEQLYPELRRLAASKMRGERGDHTWQPTALVNELYLQLIKTKLGAASEAGQRNEKEAFFGLAAHMMMRLLVHHARPLYRRVQKIPLAAGVKFPKAAAHDLNQVEALLSGLAALDPELRSVAEMKVFEGLSISEIAEQLGCSSRTVERRWNFARHWLAKELGACPPG